VVRFWLGATIDGTEYEESSLVWCWGVLCLRICIGRLCYLSWNVWCVVGFALPPQLWKSSIGWHPLIVLPSFLEMSWKDGGDGWGWKANLQEICRNRQTLLRKTSVVWWPPSPLNPSHGRHRFYGSTRTRLFPYPVDKFCCPRVRSRVFMWSICGV